MRFFPGLGKLTQSICDSLKNRVGSNLFLTPAKSQCFQAHYDENDLFILQLEGRKHWKIMQSAVTLPLEPMNNRYIDFSGLETIAEIDLDRGDILYLPRGFVHEVTTGGLFSTHITLGLEPVPWQTILMDQLTQFGFSDADLRKSFYKACQETPGSKQDQIDNLKEKILSALTAEMLSTVPRQPKSHTQQQTALITLKEATFSHSQTETV
jgi:ribosomal protein L16 Arg81 hydroxylase